MGCFQLRPRSNITEALQAMAWSRPVWHPHLPDARISRNFFSKTVANHASTAFPHEGVVGSPGFRSTVVVRGVPQMPALVFTIKNTSKLTFPSLEPYGESPRDLTSGVLIIDSRGIRVRPPVHPSKDLGNTGTVRDA